VVVNLPSTKGELNLVPFDLHPWQRILVTLPVMGEAILISKRIQTISRGSLITDNVITWLK
jgi:hypothetical protein